MRKHKEKALTDKFTHPQVVTLGVYRLGGADRFIDTEDVAQEVARLAPGRFSWRRYPDQINLELIRVYLSDAKKPGHGALLRGTGRRGWTLTTTGLAWARRAAGSLGAELLGRNPANAQGGSVATARQDRELKRLQNTIAWDKWSSSARKEITASEAGEVFRIDSYSVGEMRDLKIERVCKMFLNDPATSAFLRFMAEQVVVKE